MKRLIVGLLLLFFLAGCGNTEKVHTAEDFPLGDSPKGESRYVQDFAGILDEDQEKKLVGLSVEVEEKTTAEIVFITSILKDPENVKELAFRALHEWGVGKKAKDNGIAIVVGALPGDFQSESEDRKRKAFIATGYGNEGAVTDLQAHQVFERIMKPLFLENKWSEGLFAGGSAVANLIADDLKVNLKKASKVSLKNASPQKEGTAEPLKILIIIIIVIVVLAATAVVLGSEPGSRSSFYSSGSGGSSSGGGGYGGGSGGGGGAGGDC